MLLGYSMEIMAYVNSLDRSIARVVVTVIVLAAREAQEAHCCKAQGEDHKRGVQLLLSGACNVL